MALEIQSLHQGSAQSSSTQLRLVLCGAFWGWNPGGVKTGWGWWVHELGGQLMQEDHRLHILEQVIWRLWHWHPLQGFSFLGYQQSHLEDCARPAFCREAWKRWATGSPVGRWGLIGYCLLSYFSTRFIKHHQHLHCHHDEFLIFWRAACSWPELTYLYLQWDLVLVLSPTFFRFAPTLLMYSYALWMISLKSQFFSLHSWSFLPPSFCSSNLSLGRAVL